MQPIIGIIMGSKSDWQIMEHAAQTLERLGVAHEVRVVSAHRTPDALAEYASTAESRGLEVIIAGAGMAAHLAGCAAAWTTLPVLGVPLESGPLKGLDALLATVQMPQGVPVATFAIGKAGAVNAALHAAAIVGSQRPEVRQALARFRKEQSQAARSHPDPRSVG